MQEKEKQQQNRKIATLLSCLHHHAMREETKHSALIISFSLTDIHAERKRSKKKNESADGGEQRCVADFVSCADTPRCSHTHTHTPFFLLCDTRLPHWSFFLVLIRVYSYPFLHSPPGVGGQHWEEGRRRRDSGTFAPHFTSIITDLGHQ
jgi:hypothetical protein